MKSEKWIQIICQQYSDRSPAFLTSDDFIRSNEIVRIKWLIHEEIRHFVLMISLDLIEFRKAGDRSNYKNIFVFQLNSMKIIEVVVVYLIVY